MQYYLVLLFLQLWLIDRVALGQSMDADIEADKTPNATFLSGTADSKEHIMYEGLSVDSDSSHKPNVVRIGVIFAVALTAAMICAIALFCLRSRQKKRENKAQPAVVLAEAQISANPKNHPNANNNKTTTLVIEVEPSLLPQRPPKSSRTRNPLGSTSTSGGSSTSPTPGTTITGASDHQASPESATLSSSSDEKHRYDSTTVSSSPEEDNPMNPPMRSIDSTSGEEEHSAQGRRGVAQGDRKSHRPPISATEYLQARSNRDVEQFGMDEIEEKGATRGGTMEIKGGTECVTENETRIDPSHDAAAAAAVAEKSKQSPNDGRELGETNRTTVQNVSTKTDVDCRNQINEREFEPKSNIGLLSTTTNDSQAATLGTRKCELTCEGEWDSVAEGPEIYTRKLFAGFSKSHLSRQNAVNSSIKNVDDGEMTGELTVADQAHPAQLPKLHADKIASMVLIDPTKCDPDGRVAKDMKSSQGSMKSRLPGPPFNDEFYKPKLTGRQISELPTNQYSKPSMTQNIPEPANINFEDSKICSNHQTESVKCSNPNRNAAGTSANNTNIPDFKTSNENQNKIVKCSDSTKFANSKTFITNQSESEKFRSSLTETGILDEVTPSLDDSFETSSYRDRAGKILDLSEENYGNALCSDFSTSSISTLATDSEARLPSLSQDIRKNTLDRPRRGILAPNNSIATRESNNLRETSTKSINKSMCHTTELASVDNTEVNAGKIAKNGEDDSNISIVSKDKTGEKLLNVSDLDRLHLRLAEFRKNLATTETNVTPTIATETGTTYNTTSATTDPTTTSEDNDKLVKTTETVATYNTTSLTTHKKVENPNTFISPSLATSATTYATTTSLSPENNDKLANTASEGVVGDTSSESTPEPRQGRSRNKRSETFLVKPNQITAAMQLNREPTKNVDLKMGDTNNNNNNNENKHKQSSNAMELPGTTTLSPILKQVPKAVSFIKPPSAISKKRQISQGTIEAPGTKIPTMHVAPKIGSGIPKLASKRSLERGSSPGTLPVKATRLPMSTVSSDGRGKIENENLKNFSERDGVPVSTVNARMNGNDKMNFSDKSMAVGTNSIGAMKEPVASDSRNSINTPTSTSNNRQNSRENLELHLTGLVSPSNNIGNLEVVSKISKIPPAAKGDVPKSGLPKSITRIPTPTRTSRSSKSPIPNNASKMPIPKTTPVQKRTVVA